MQYTITSDSFRRKYFSAVQVSGGKCKASEVLGPQLAWATNVTERELTVDRDGHKPWHFDTEVFTNSYKVFQFVRSPKSAISR